MTYLELNNKMLTGLLTGETLQIPAVSLFQTPESSPVNF
jgi:hypothetical protein